MTPPKKRSKTLSGKLRVQEMQAGVDATEYMHLNRPRTRADCVDGPRPCPWVGCKHNLYCDIDRNGALKIAWPQLEPWEMLRSCTLDIVKGGDRMSLEDVAVTLQMTRERIRQIELAGVDAMRASSEMEGIGAASPGSPVNAEQEKQARPIANDAEFEEYDHAALRYRDLVNTTAAAAMIGVAKSDFHSRIVGTGRITPVVRGRPGRPALFDRADVERLARERGVEL